MFNVFAAIGSFPKVWLVQILFLKLLKAYDESGTGFLSVADFRKVLRQYGVNLSEEEFFHLLEYYDKTLSAKISYNDFLRAFLQ